VIWVERVVANVSGSDAQDGDACRFGYLLFQAFEVVINGPGLPACVGDNGVVDFREDALGGQGKRRAGLDAGA
jgi:hypothetical protein